MLNCVAHNYVLNFQQIYLNFNIYRHKFIVTNNSIGFYVNDVVVREEVSVAQSDYRFWCCNWHSVIVVLDNVVWRVLHKDNSWSIRWQYFAPLIYSHYREWYMSLHIDSLISFELSLDFVEQRFNFLVMLSTCDHTDY